jgi:hypothetical protein
MILQRVIKILIKDKSMCTVDRKSYVVHIRLIGYPNIDQ